MLNSIFSRLQAGGSPKRFDMLRHTRFLQFPTQEFGNNVTPHQMHWSLEESLEDQGVSDIKGEGPTVITHWTKVVPGENGKESNVADYMSFEGHISGRRGEPVPAWAKLGRILSIVLTFIGGAAQLPLLLILGLLGGFGFSLFIWYWNKFRCGQVTCLYRGTYMQPAEETRKNDWRFSLDLMCSINLEKEIGKAVVDPIYAYMETSLLNDISKSKGTRTQPELISRKKDSFEVRFPVQGA